MALSPTQLKAQCKHRLRSGHKWNDVRGFLSAEGMAESAVEALMTKTMGEMRGQAGMVIGGGVALAVVGVVVRHAGGIQRLCADAVPMVGPGANRRSTCCRWIGEDRETPHEMRTGRTRAWTTTVHPPRTAAEPRVTLTGSLLEEILKNNMCGVFS